MRAVKSQRPARVQGKGYTRLLLKFHNTTTYRNCSSTLQQELRRNLQCMHAAQAPKNPCCRPSGDELSSVTRWKQASEQARRLHSSAWLCDDARRRLHHTRIDALSFSLDSVLVHLHVLGSLPRTTRLYDVSPHGKNLPSQAQHSY